ncbi:hypothetical protein [Pontibacter flavimaris]|uniref:STAS/SEC14 domain-containing protein n=1 Tax=Pontibacter flavimaris TaxID=1797110 RepID=A0A1Q5P8V6_9BACT|nr:hypothetical protein [Pontibacter flavimaris]OKL38675.1 hypothetical protein A3841_05920 [Pontibacter flavimaris]
MLIPNQFIKLEFNPALDILSVEWPNIHDYTVHELRFILAELVSTVKNYDIKKILADSRNSALTLPEQEYGAIVEKFAHELSTTRLRKFARLTTGLDYREKTAGKAAEDMKDCFQVRSFYTMAEALAWLNA